MSRWAGGNRGAYLRLLSIFLHLKMPGWTVEAPLAWLWFSTHVVDEVAGRGVGTHLGSGAICDLLTSGVIFGGVFVAIVAFIVMASSWTCEEEAGGDVAGISLPAMGGIEAKGALR